MTRIANRFTNPQTADTYDWEINHSEEEELGKKRNITHGARTSGTGLVKVQGDDEPLIWRLSGSILSEDQLSEMWTWFELCRTQTIYFRDFTGTDEYEVIITDFQPRRERTIRNPRDSANAPYHTWKYTMEMEIIAVRAGPLDGLSP